MIYVPVPILNVLSRASELIPQAHANHIGHAVKDGGHPSESLNPEVRVEILVAKEPIPIGAAATPTGLAYVIVQYDHHLVSPQARDHRLRYSNFLNIKIKLKIQRYQYQN
jgi:hypothetical protein